MRLLFVFVFLFGLVSCGEEVKKKSNIISKKDYNKLKNDLEKCSSENEELKNTPQNRLLKAQKLEKNGFLNEAKQEYEDLIKKFPDSEQSQKALTYLKIIKKESERKKIELERKKRLGYKILKARKIIKQGNCKLTFTDIKLSSKWIFDRYDDSWYERKAERGKKYISSTVKIKSEINTPNLPPIYVYQLIDGDLKFKSAFYYKFYRWEDYGSYLGNYADYSNDFSRTETVKFTIGAEINIQDHNKYPTFIMVKKSNCVSKTFSKYDNPNVSYSNFNCTKDISLSPERAESDYHTIKIFNL